ncbi:helix-turn-helix transcriptional regulator [Halobacillus locisalis]|uniref:Helix-turn-helix transcriptional regulator n=1 Tax=Halobacillus locisalis TaxID=220753 RepID=A0A838CPU3_9BACI|nr:helix-turn-helix transcriptional regulator [Halobacillus locisalis]MBA2173775.1 helix-turn-helix transcriptional regulator [Halobacillus locisalis]
MKNKIAQYRKEKSLSQERLAHMLKVSRQTVISIEKDRYSPSLPLAFQLAKIFEVSIEELFIYEEEE